MYIPKTNGKLRPLGISTLRDRVCMTAAMLVLEPIYEADFPSELYAYRPGRNAQQAVVEVEELLFRGHPDVVRFARPGYDSAPPHRKSPMSLYNGLPSGVIDIPRIETVRRAQDASRESGGRTDDADSHCARRVNDSAGKCARSVSVVVVRSGMIAIAVDGVDRDIVSGRVAVNANVAMIGPGRSGCDSKT